MATFTERLVLLITAEANGVDAAGAAAARGLAPAEQAAAATSSAMLGIGAAAALAGAGAVKGLDAAFDAVTDVSREALKLQRLTGATAEDASGIAFAAQQTGIPIDKLGASIAILSKNGEKLAAIGVNLRDANGQARPFVNVLEDIAGRIEALPAGLERTKLARDLFGRGGADLLPLLSKGKDEVAALVAAAEDFGLVLDQDTLDAVKSNIKATRELSAAWTGFKVQVGGEILPAVTSGLSTFTDVVKGGVKAMESVPGLTPLIAGGGAVVATLGLVGGGALLVSAAGSKVKAGWSKIDVLFDRTATAMGRQSAEAEANAAANLEAAAAADKLATSQDRAGAATEGAAVAGGRGSGLKGAAVKGLTAAFAVDIGFDIVNSIAGIDAQAGESMNHFVANMKGGTATVVRNFRNDLVQLEGDTQKWSHLITDITDNSFKLGGVGKEANVSDMKAAFDRLLSGQGPEAAQTFLDALKAEDAALDHNGDEYRQSEALRRSWQRAVNDAVAAQRISTGATDDNTAALDRFGLALDSTKSKAANYATNLQTAAAAPFAAIGGADALAEANRKVEADKKKLAELAAGGGGGSGAGDESGVASASQRVASARRDEAAANRELQQSGHDLAAAKANLARADAGGDPTRIAAAQDAVANAEDARAAALDRQRGAQAANASSQRDLNLARHAAIKEANDLADAEDRIASAERDQAAAARSLRSAQRDLTRLQEQRGRVNAERDPARAQQLDDNIADARDKVADAKDRVSSANESAAKAERDLLEVRAASAAKADERGEAEQQLAADTLAAGQAAITYQSQLAALYDFLAQNPDAIPGLKQQFQDLVDQGLIPQSTADAVIARLDAITAAATRAAGAAGLISIPPLAGAGPTQPGQSRVPNSGGTVPRPLAGAGPTQPGQARGAAAFPPPPLVGSGPTQAGQTRSAAASPTRDLGGFLRSFPANPKAAQSFVIGGRSFVWNGSDWVGGDKAKAFETWKVRGYAAGGLVDGVGNADTEHIVAMPGEFVMRKDVVASLGVDYFASLNAGQPPQRYAGGGVVGGPRQLPDPRTLDVTGPGRFDHADDDVGRKLDRILDAINQMTPHETINIDQRGYEKPPTTTDTARAIRSGKFLGEPAMSTVELSDWIVANYPTGWTGATNVAVLMVGTGFEWDPSLDAFTLAGAGDNGDNQLASGPVNGRTNTSGVADATDVVTDASVESPESCGALWLVNYDVTQSICFITLDTPIPFDADVSYSIVWDNGPNKIFTVPGGLGGGPTVTPVEPPPDTADIEPIPGPVDDEPTPISVNLYDEDNETLIGPIESAVTGTQHFQVSLNAADSGGLEVPVLVSDETTTTVNPELTALQRGRYLRFSLNGTERVSVRIADRTQKSIDSKGNENAQRRTIAAKGLLSEWGDAVLPPAPGSEFFDVDTRHFGWMSKEADVSGWDDVTYSRAVFAAGFEHPEPWVDGFGGVFDASTLRYFVFDLVLDDPTLASLHTAFGDQGRVWVNSAPVGQGKPPPSSNWADTLRCGMRFGAGTHRFAFDIQGLPGAAEPRFTATAYEINDATTGRMNADTFLFRTGNISGGAPYAWKGSATAEGPTVKGILRSVLEQIQTEQELLLDWVIDGADDTLDSNGETLERIADHPAQITTRGDDFLIGLTAAHCDLGVSTAAKTLYVYRWRERGVFHTSPKSAPELNGEFFGASTDPDRLPNIVDLGHEERRRR